MKETPLIGRMENEVPFPALRDENVIFFCVLPR
jgi:hypothetical protein